MSTPEQIIAEALGGSGCNAAYFHAHTALAALKDARYHIVKLPEPDETIPGTDDEHGLRQWWIDADVVAAFDSGVVDLGFAQYHGTDTGRLKTLAAALLARC